MVLMAKVVPIPILRLVVLLIPMVVLVKERLQGNLVRLLANCILMVVTALVKRFPLQQIPGTVVVVVE